MESKKINQLATELTPALSDLTIIGDPTTGISKKITLSQMASLFTGTVEEYPDVASFPLVGVADTIYIALDTNVLYRWDTTLTSYVELSPNIINSLVFNDANGFDGTISLVGSVATLTITTALTTGSVGFIGASGALTQDNSNFYWDNSNKRLGINTNAPTTALDAFGSGIIGRLNGTSTNNSFLGFASAGTNKWSIGNVQSDHRFRIYSEANTAELISVLQTGEFGIGIANPTTKIHIDGGASALIANLDANVSVAKSISYRSDNSNRINLEVSGTESGLNAGADFFLRTYTDAGALIETPFQIKRSTGNTGFGTTPGTSRLEVAGGELNTNTVTYSLGLSSGLTIGRFGTYQASSLSAISTYYDFTAVEISAGSSAGKVTGLSMNGGNNTTNPNTLLFYTASVEAMRIINNGNIGVLNNNPFNGISTLKGIAIADRGGIFKLNVNDVIYTSNNLYYDGANWKRIVAGGGTFMQLESVDGGTFAISSAATGSAGSNATLIERFKISSSGNIGVNNNMPLALLDLYLSSVGTYFRGGSDNVARQLKMSSSTTTNAGDTHTIDAQSGTGNLILATTSIQRLRITSSGNILIDNGELNTPKTLSFEGNNNGSSNNTLGDIRWYNYQWDGAIRAQIKGEFDSALSNGRLTFFTSTEERLRIGAIGFTASIIGASDANSKTFMNQVNRACGLIPTPAGSTLYLYSRDGGGTNLRVTLTSSTYFTGQHGNKPIDMGLKTNIEDYIGMIVSSVGSYYSVNPITNEVTTGIDAIQISEALPEIKLTDKDEDKSVWGVITNVKNDNYNTDGTTEYDNDPQFGDRLGENVIRVNGLGEGAIWITNINGNIENGDFICSSVIAGYGKKQNDDLLHNYTVAKSTMDCDFDLNNEGLYKCEEFEYNGQTYKKAFIGCTYHCS